MHIIFLTLACITLGFGLGGIETWYESENNPKEQLFMGIIFCLIGVIFLIVAIFSEVYIGG